MIHCEQVHLTMVTAPNVKNAFLQAPLQPECTQIDVESNHILLQPHCIFVERRSYHRNKAASKICKNQNGFDKEIRKMLDNN